MKSIKISSDIIRTARNIENKTLSPLCGFMGYGDFFSVLDNMRLVSGEIWSMPIVLPVNKKSIDLIRRDKVVKLVYDKWNNFELRDIEIFENPKAEFAKKVFGTKNLSHPGVANVFAMEGYFLGGKVANVKSNFTTKNSLIPEQIKKIFQKNNWKKVAAFQTRNVPHRGHEFLHHEALQETDGLLIHPLSGYKKAGDFKIEHVVGAYKTLIDSGYYGSRALVSELPVDMYYAGPREALFHAIIRKNYGCTHLIVGRDHAGVGDFYHPEAAQKIFDNFSHHELKIKALKFPEVVYDGGTDSLKFAGGVQKSDILKFSGTKLRKYIKEKREIPEIFLRKEVSEYLFKCHDLFI